MFLPGATHENGFVSRTMGTTQVVAVSAVARGGVFVAAAPTD